MSRYNKSNNRDQLSIEPLCLDDMLPEDAEVRALEVIVDKMDIRSLGFTYSETKETGRKPYDPSDMFKIYAYSYFNGIRSSRKIERECYRNIELMWLIGNIRPDFKTIADFRKDNKAQIKAAFLRFNMICAELGLVGKEIVAIDGSKFRAGNSRFACHTEKKIEKKLEYFTKTMNDYMELLDICDNEESKEPKFSRSEIVDKIDKLNSRIVELRELQEKVRQNGPIYDTDPDSRMMRVSNNGADVAHNVQIAVDEKNHMVVAIDVTSQPIDKEQLYNMASQAKENLGADELTVVADRGYYSANEFELCENESIHPIVTEANQTHHAIHPDYEKDKFAFDEDQNCYICPAGEILSVFSVSKKGSIKYANMTACKNCSHKYKCTKAKYRAVQDRPNEKYARIVDKRTKENIELYRKRQQLVEHPFGTVKRALGFTYFLTRGTESVKAESCLHFLIYNIKRTINIMGTQELRAILQG